jgi:hypothetical protein
MKRLSYLYLLLILTCLDCQTNKPVSSPVVTASPVPAAAAASGEPESPVLSPAAALQQMQVKF